MAEFRRASVAARQHRIKWLHYEHILTGRRLCEDSQMGIMDLPDQALVLLITKAPVLRMTCRRAAAITSIADLTKFALDIRTPSDLMVEALWCRFPLDKFEAILETTLKGLPATDRMLTVTRCFELVANVDSLRQQQYHLALIKAGVHPHALGDGQKRIFDVPALTNEHDLRTYIGRENPCLHDVAVSLAANGDANLLAILALDFGWTGCRKLLHNYDGLLPSTYDVLLDLEKSFLDVRDFRNHFVKCSAPWDWNTDIWCWAISHDRLPAMEAARELVSMLVDNVERRSPVNDILSFIVLHVLGKQVPGVTVTDLLRECVLRSKPIHTIERDGFLNGYVGPSDVYDVMNSIRTPIRFLDDWLEKI